MASRNLWHAVASGSISQVQQTQDVNETVDPNWGNPVDKFSTALYVACSKGFDEIVFLLLKHPKIDPNKGNIYLSPLYTACERNHVNVVKQLVLHPRINLDYYCRNDTSKMVRPIVAAIYNNNVQVVKLLLAFANDRMKMDDLDSWSKTHTEISQVFEAFTNDRNLFIKNVRREIGYYEKGYSNETFALVVLVSDGILKIKNHDHDINEEKRFFQIMNRLSIELQMIVCSQIEKKTFKVILSKDLEPSLRKVIQWRDF